MTAEARNSADGRLMEGVPAFTVAAVARLKKSNMKI
jgi:hypothetical protein